jgi:hypothetical protein
MEPRLIVAALPPTPWSRNEPPARRGWSEKSRGGSFPKSPVNAAVPGPCIAACETSCELEQAPQGRVGVRAKERGMTHRDPYRDRTSNEDEDPYAVRGVDQEPHVVRADGDRLSARSMIGAVIAIAVVVAALIYTIQRTSMSVATGPSTNSTSPPGQGGTAPHAAR